jgi:hypothetical protein
MRMIAMLSRSRSAAIEALWLPALFTLDQGGADHLNLCAALLLSSNEITDIFTIVGVIATFDLRP